MSFIKVSQDDLFTFDNLPYGIFSTQQQPTPRPGVAIGKFVLDLSQVHRLLPLQCLSAEETERIFTAQNLNALMEQNQEVWKEVRKAVRHVLSEESQLKEDQSLREKALVKLEDVIMHLPCNIGDYTDFYSSLEHARNVGMMFRPNAEPLLPNWKYLPVGYHGRASSIIVSGTPIRRPLGQTRPKETEPPVFGPSKRLDFELEVGFFVGGKSNKLGHPISIDKTEEHIFGVVLMNDWSARDIQKWEYVPLGPFLAKNFATTISPWVVPMEALEAFKVKKVTQDPEPLEYLRSKNDSNYDIDLFVDLVRKTKDGFSPPTRICSSNFKHMYWTMRQQLAHHSISGCNMRAGDLLASGTVSGPTPDSYGSLLELSWNGTKPVQLKDGSSRTFIEDFDEIVITGEAKNASGIKISFGYCSGVVLPVVELK